MKAPVPSEQNSEDLHKPSRLRGGGAAKVRRFCLGACSVLFISHPTGLLPRSTRMLPLLWCVYPSHNTDFVRR
jgi:hypothetical protein